MSTRIHLIILTAFLFFLPAIEPAKSGARGREGARQTRRPSTGPRQPAAPQTRQAMRAMLIEARNLAYDANFRNDQAGLRAAIAAMEPLAREPEVEAYAHYYLSWTYWMLVGVANRGEEPGGGARVGQPRTRPRARRPDVPQPRRGLPDDAGQCVDCDGHSRSRAGQGAVGGAGGGPEEEPSSSVPTIRAR